MLLLHWFRLPSILGVILCSLLLENHERGRCEPRFLRLPLNHRKNAWHEKECGKSGDAQVANYGPSQRRVASPPSPNPRAIGTLPMIMAEAVMMTGRMRTKPACKAASRASCLIHLFSCERHHQNVLGRGHTMHMIAPVSEGTLKRGVSNQKISLPARSPGSAVMMMKGSSHD